MPYKDKERDRAYRAAHYAAYRAEIIVSRAAWRAAHKAEIRAQNVAYRISHREKLAAYEAARSAARKVGSCAYQAAYRKTHRTDRCVSSATWRKAHPEARRVQMKRRRAQAAGVPINDLTKVEWEERVNEYHGLCAYCLEPLGTATQDHMTPLSRGGSHTLSNLIPSCQSCNSSKHTKTLLEFVIATQGVFNAVDDS